jgi:protein-L-isoaspartate(D-aspartate) O-methyltransferase
VRDERVIQALEAVPRAGFVAVEELHRAYFDEPLPVPHRQVTTQPSLTAKMIEAFALTGSERVLEIGTGYGFQTALLAHLVPFVWSVERWADLAETAREHLARHGVDNVEIVVGDGSGGLPEHAPYDAVLVSAAFPSVPEPLVRQLAPGGRLVQPLGPGGREDIVVFELREEGLVPLRSVTGAHFVRLIGRHAFRR